MRNNKRRYRDISSLEWQRFLSAHTTSDKRLSPPPSVSYFHSMCLASHSWFTFHLPHFSLLICRTSVSKRRWCWCFFQPSKILRRLIDSMSNRITYVHETPAVGGEKIDNFTRRTCVKTINWSTQIWVFRCPPRGLLSLRIESNFQHAYRLLIKIKNNQTPF